MKRTGIFFGIFFLYSTNVSLELEKLFNYKTKKVPHAITYKLENWRRLGDTLLTYCKAKYFSHVFDLPVLYKPFPYSDQFTLSQQEIPLDEAKSRTFCKTVIVNKAQDIQEHWSHSEPILFECHFLSESPSMYFLSRQAEYKDYEKEIKRMLTPVCPIEQLPKPPNVITVAVHVRKGGGFDRPLGSSQEYDMPGPIKGFYLRKNNPHGPHTDIWPLLWTAGPKYIESVSDLTQKKQLYSDYIWPIKFPADQFYINQIKKLTELIPHKNILIYFFTDDSDPEKIVHRYMKALETYPRIIFSYRNQGNHHTKNVLTDLFLMAQCDCLISANSSFANVAQLVGNHSLLLFPLEAVTLPDKIIISKTGLIRVSNPLEKTRQVFFESVQEKTK